MKVLVSLFGIFLCFAVGYYISSSSMEFPNYDLKLAELNNVKSRDPAAIKKVYDFSHLKGSALQTALKERLISAARVVRFDEGIGIELGHFVVKNPEGHREFACQRFTRVVMGFEGVGMAVSGEPPKMEVDGKCEISEDVNTISPLKIPVARIRGEKVNDGEFDYKDLNGIRIRFANVSDEWPSLWSLKFVRLYNSEVDNGEVAIGTEEIHRISSKPFIIEFPK